MLPKPPQELLLELSRRYVLLYEIITGERFPFPGESEPSLHGAKSGMTIDWKGEQAETGVAEAGGGRSW